MKRRKPVKERSGPHWVDAQRYYRLNFPIDPKGSERNPITLKEWGDERVQQYRVVSVKNNEIVITPLRPVLRPLPKDYMRMPPLSSFFK